MYTGFNTTGNLQTYGRTSQSVSLGKTGNSIGSITRKFNYCNSVNKDLNIAFRCTFDGFSSPQVTPVPPVPPIPSSTFTYTFYNTTNTSNLTPYVPLITSGGQASFTYKSYVIGPNNLTRVDVSWSFNDNGTTGDGLSFSDPFSSVSNFYNTQTNPGVNILQFSGIPISRKDSTGSRGYQFATINNLVISASDTPTILSNTHFGYMYYQCNNFNSNINSWNTTGAITMNHMFDSCASFNQPLDNWVTSGVTTMNSMFAGCSVFNQSVSNFDTSNVTDMGSMFAGCSTFNQSVSNFDTSNVTDMGSMFAGCSVFNQSVSNFNTSNVTGNGMQAMFSGCYNFNQPVNNFNTSNITNFYYMFSNCYSFNQPVSNFNTSNVVNMQSMFSGASVFNQDVSMWNVSLVGSGPNGAPSFAGMFKDATKFNNGVVVDGDTKPLTTWNTSNAINMNQMFNNASIFNQSVQGWNTTNLRFIYQMFNGASAFNNGQNTGGTTQPLNWTSIASITNYGNWHDGSNLTNINATPLNVPPYW